MVQKVTNGQISINHSAKTYEISRSTIDYWVKKLATFN
ncbi:helix-turn-helix domain-containing protein [Chryseobacterium sp. TY3]